MQLTKQNMKEVKGQSGVLQVKFNNNVLREFITDDVYPLYNTIKSLMKRPIGCYSKLPKRSVFEFMPNK